MRDTNGGFRLVAFLSAGARAAHCVATAFGEKLLFCKCQQACSFWIVLNGGHEKGTEATNGTNTTNGMKEKRPCKMRGLLVELAEFLGDTDGIHGVFRVVRADRLRVVIRHDGTADDKLQVVETAFFGGFDDGFHFRHSGRH